MDFFEVVRRRRSVRSFATHPVEGHMLQAILESANAAPSAGNLQAYAIVVATRAATREALARAALDQWQIAEAPVVLVFCTDARRSSVKYGRRGAELYALQDATIACASAQLAATALGLASCWVGAFDEERIQRPLKIPSGLTPIALLPIGYPAESPMPTERRSLDDLVRYEREPS